MFNRLSLKDIGGLLNTEARSESLREVRDQGYEEVYTHAIEPNYYLFFYFPCLRPSFCISLIQ